MSEINLEYPKYCYKVRLTNHEWLKNLDFTIWVSKGFGKPSTNCRHYNISNTTGWAVLRYERFLTESSPGLRTYCYARLQYAVLFINCVSWRCSIRESISI